MQAQVVFKIKYGEETRRFSFAKASAEELYTQLTEKADAIAKGQPHALQYVDDEGDKVVFGSSEDVNVLLAASAPNVAPRLELVLGADATPITMTSSWIGNSKLGTDSTITTTSTANSKPVSAVDASKTTQNNPTSTKTTPMDCSSNNENNDNNKTNCDYKPPHHKLSAFADDANCHDSFVEVSRKPDDKNSNDDMAEDEDVVTDMGDKQEIPIVPAVIPLGATHTHPQNNVPPTTGGNVLPQPAPVAPHTIAPMSQSPTPFQLAPVQTATNQQPGTPVQPPPPQNVQEQNSAVQPGTPVQNTPVQTTYQQYGTPTHDQTAHPQLGTPVPFQSTSVQNTLGQTTYPQHGTPAYDQTVYPQLGTPVQPPPSQNVQEQNSAVQPGTPVQNAPVQTPYQQHGTPVSFQSTPVQNIPVQITDPQYGTPALQQTAFPRLGTPVHNQAAPLHTSFEHATGGQRENQTVQTTPVPTQTSGTQTQQATAAGTQTTPAVPTGVSRNPFTVLSRVFGLFASLFPAGATGSRVMEVVPSLSAALTAAVLEENPVTFCGYDVARLCVLLMDNKQVFTQCSLDENLRARVAGALNEFATSPDTAKALNQMITNTLVFCKESCNYIPAPLIEEMETCRDSFWQSYSQVVPSQSWLGGAASQVAGFNHAMQQTSSQNANNMDTRSDVGVAQPIAENLHGSTPQTWHHTTTNNNTTFQTPTHGDNFNNSYNAFTGNDNNNNGYNNGFNNSDNNGYNNEFTNNGYNNEFNNNGNTNNGYNNDFTGTGNNNSGYSNDFNNNSNTNNGYNNANANTGYGNPHSTNNSNNSQVDLTQSQFSDFGDNNQNLSASMSQSTFPAPTLQVLQPPALRAQYFAGDVIYARWRVKNVGSMPCKGIWLQPQDGNPLCVQVGQNGSFKVFTNNIAPGQEAEISLMANIPASATGFVSAPFLPFDDDGTIVYDPLVVEFRVSNPTNSGAMQPVQNWSNEPNTTGVQYTQQQQHQYQHQHQQHHQQHGHQTHQQQTAPPARNPDYLPPTTNSATEKQMTDGLRELRVMGFDDEARMRALLTQHNFDVNRVAEALLDS